MARTVGTTAWLGVLWMGAALLGCEETVEGRYLDTEGIAMVVDVTATSADASEVKVEFKAGGDESNTYVDLEDDEVSITGGSAAKVAGEDGTGRYSAAFDTGEGGTEFTVALDRTDEEKTDAPDSHGVLPEPFEVMLEPEGNASRAEALTVRWEPSGGADEVRIDFDGDCLYFTFETGEADDGEYVVEAGELVFGSSDAEGDCEATVTVTRTLFGATDPAFDAESEFRLHQQRSLAFDSTP